MVNNAMTKLCKYSLIATLVLTPSSVLAQNVVKGTVLDSNNEPVIGASVIEKGNPKNGTVTDLDGNFTLNLKKGKTAVISYIGMQAQEIQMGGVKSDHRIEGRQQSAQRGCCRRLYEQGS